MRTTLELDDDLLRAAKSFAAVHGESLKNFFTRAITHELGRSALQRPSRRVKLPLVASKGVGAAVVTNEDIEELFSAEDSEKYGNR